MTAPISPELRAFLADWLAWVERGAPEGEPFNRAYGLCTNALFYATEAYSALKATLCADFGDDEQYPFGGLASYDRAGERRSMHKSKTRLAWVRAKLAEGGEA